MPYSDMWKGWELQGGQSVQFSRFEIAGRGQGQTGLLLKDRFDLIKFGCCSISKDDSQKPSQRFANLEERNMNLMLSVLLG